MKKAIAFQMLIFIAAWFSVTPDTLEDNTHLWGLFGDVEVIKGNVHWVMMTAGILSVFNIWVWWPKKSTTPSESSTPVVAEGTKSATDKVIDQDPKTPTLD